jgi:methyl coenzyme M reductase subunit C-like uncharacterized protein (methanogenesis marker protein 7)
MTRFFGKVGYGIPAEGPADSGIWDDVIVEQSYYGDIVRNSRRLQTGESINDDLTLGNSISIVADEYAVQHFHVIRFVEYANAAWIVSEVDASTPPRLILRLGGVYNGPRANPDTP